MVKGRQKLSASDNDMTFKEHVSVCMITCNGSSYITKQVDSILGQLHSEDELIVCDDCSEDETVSLIGSYHDPRIKLVENPTRLGVKKNIEKSIGHAKNRFVFLADQDDIWEPDKVERILHVFHRHQNISLVMSNGKVINDRDEEVKEFFVEFSSPVQPGIIRAIKNIVKNIYTGAAIAFRREMARYILPIPADVPMHDMWIGILNDMYGKTYYLDEPLIRYRRHSGNLTSGRHSSPRQILRWRLVLIRRLVERAIALAGKGGRSRPM